MRRPARILDDFQPGDLLFFAGRNPESRLIALGTCSFRQLALERTWFSHVGIVTLYRGEPMLFESTTFNPDACEIQLRKVNGPQSHSPAQRVGSYPGKVWRLRIAQRKALLPSETDRLTDFLVSKLGDGYDYEGAIISGTHFLRVARWIRPSLDKLFCSYYAMEALQDIRRVDQSLSAASYNPARMARDLVWWETYQPLGYRGSESVRLK